MGICLCPEQQLHNLELNNNTPETQITVMYFDYYYLRLYFLHIIYTYIIYLLININ